MVLVLLEPGTSTPGQESNSSPNSKPFNATAAMPRQDNLAKSLSTRGTVKTAKQKGDKRNHLVMNESDYGTYLALRPVELAAPARNARCSRRKSDNKFACFPDVIYIGTSKSGTTSMAAHLSHHPMIQNILSKNESEKRRSKEGHYWERERLGRRINSTDLHMWINYTKNDVLEQQEGFDTLATRPVLIEYSPNYFVLDHVPELLRSQFHQKMKFIVSLRDPISRTISSWKFKAKEGLKNHNIKDDPFNVSVDQGISQSECIIGYN